MRFLWFGCLVVGSLALLSFGIAYVQYVVRGELSRRFASFEFARTRAAASVSTSLTRS